MFKYTDEFRSMQYFRSELKKYNLNLTRRGKSKERNFSIPSPLAYDIEVPSKDHVEKISFKLRRSVKDIKSMMIYDQKRRTGLKIDDERFFRLCQLYIDMYHYERITGDKIVPLNWLSFCAGMSALRNQTKSIKEIKKFKQNEAGFGSIIKLLFSPLGFFMYSVVVGISNVLIAPNSFFYVKHKNNIYYLSQQLVSVLPTGFLSEGLAAAFYSDDIAQLMSASSSEWNVPVDKISLYVRVKWYGREYLTVYLTDDAFDSALSKKGWKKVSDPKEKSKLNDLFKEIKETWK